MLFKFAICLLHVCCKLLNKLRLCWAWCCGNMTCWFPVTCHRFHLGGLLVLIPDCVFLGPDDAEINEVSHANIIWVSRLVGHIARYAATPKDHYWNCWFTDSYNALLTITQILWHCSSMCDGHSQIITIISEFVTELLQFL